LIFNHHKIENNGDKLYVEGENCEDVKSLNLFCFYIKFNLIKLIKNYSPIISTLGIEIHSHNENSKHT